MFECSTRDFPSLLGSNFDGNFFKNHFAIRGVSTDSRDITPGCLYIPLKGERFDGHEFISDAIRKGAVCALSEHSGTPKNLPVVKVRNTLEALGQLGTAWRLIVAPKTVIGLTGSNGKTSTKEFLKHFSRTTRKTYATEGNLNNHIGVPLTLLRMPKKVDVAVIEMGMNHLGEIDQLAKIARPNWGVITGIGTAHIGEVGSIENIAKAKCELIPHLVQHPHLFIGLNHESLLPWIKHLRIPTYLLEERGQEQSKYLDQDNFLRATYTCKQKSLTRLEMTVSEARETTELSASVFGLHFANNILLALKVAQALGCTPKRLLNALKTLKLPPMRSQVVHKKSQPATWVIDCYNANPDSLSGLLATLQSYKLSSGSEERIVLALGDMKELGNDSIELHRQFARPIAELKPKAVYTLGEHSQALSEALLSLGQDGMRVHHVPSLEVLRDRLKAESRTKSLIVMKASRGMELEKALPWNTGSH